MNPLNPDYALSLEDMEDHKKYRCRVCCRKRWGRYFSEHHHVCDWCVRKDDWDTCDTCGERFMSNKGSTKWCSDKCNPNTAMGRYHLFERDGFRCIYCGRSSIEDDVELEVDHVHPRALNGIDHASNLITACVDCNRQKSSKPLLEGNEQRILDEIARRNSLAGLDGARIRD